LIEASQGYPRIIAIEIALPGRCEEIFDERHRKQPGGDGVDADSKGEEKVPAGHSPSRFRLRILFRRIFVDGFGHGTIS
jgi:hypothetical protein